MTKKNNVPLFEAMSELHGEGELKKFMKDLCTPQEIEAMEERWRVCQLLALEGLSYREIHKRTGVSLVTIGRVARFLNNEKNQGYQLLLKRLFTGTGEEE